MHSQLQDPPQTQKQTAPDPVPVYTRRGFATFAQSFHVLVGILFIVIHITLLILNPSYTKQRFKVAKYLLNFGVPSYTNLSILLIIDGLIMSITAAMTLIEPDFLHRERNAVIKSLLPLIIVGSIARILLFYHLGPGLLPNMVGLVVYVFGMLQGSKNNLLASLLVPFRKQ